jgi:hypothetical protein
VSNLLKSPRYVACRAVAIGHGALRCYAHRYSPKKYTQPQLFACLVLKAFFKIDYRGIVVYLVPLAEKDVTFSLKTRRGNASFLTAGVPAEWEAACPTTFPAPIPGDHGPPPLRGGQRPQPCHLRRTLGHAEARNGCSNSSLPGGDSVARKAKPLYVCHHRPVNGYQRTDQNLLDVQVGDAVPFDSFAREGGVANEAADLRHSFSTLSGESPTARTDRGQRFFCTAVSFFT